MKVSIQDTIYAVLKRNKANFVMANYGIVEFIAVYNALFDWQIYNLETFSIH